MGLEGADLRELRALLDDIDPRQTLGNLSRTTEEDNETRWVCRAHLSKPHGLQWQNAIIDSINANIGESKAHEKEAIISDEVNFRKIEEICKIIMNGLRIERVTLNDCIMDRNGLIKLIDAINHS